MNKRIAIGAVVALLASLAFATVASASEGFDDGDYTINLPDGPVEFTITDGALTTNPFSDDAEDEIRITSGSVEIEIDVDDAKIEISGLTPEEAAQVTVALGSNRYTQDDLPENWEIAFDDDTLTDDDSVDSDDEDDIQITTDDDSDSTDDDTLDDDDSADDDSGD